MGSRKPSEVILGKSNFNEFWGRFTSKMAWNRCNKLQSENFWKFDFQNFSSKVFSVKSAPNKTCLRVSSRASKPQLGLGVTLALTVWIQTSIVIFSKNAVFCDISDHSFLSSKWDSRRAYGKVMRYFRNICWTRRPIYIPSLTLRNALKVFWCILKFYEFWVFWAILLHFFTFVTRNVLVCTQKLLVLSGTEKIRFRPIEHHSKRNLVSAKILDLVVKVGIIDFGS